MSPLSSWTPADKQRVRELAGQWFVIAAMAASDHRFASSLIDTVVDVVRYFVEADRAARGDEPIAKMVWGHAAAELSEAIGPEALTLSWVELLGVVKALRAARGEGARFKVGDRVRRKPGSLAGTVTGIRPATVLVRFDGYTIDIPWGEDNLEAPTPAPPDEEG